jgi:hypothetical protein
MLWLSQKDAQPNLPCYRIVPQGIDLESETRMDTGWSQSSEMLENGSKNPAQSFPGELNREQRCKWAEVRKLLKSRKVKPTWKALQTSLGCRQEEVGMYLNRAVAEGILEARAMKNGRLRYQYAQA